MEFWDIRNTNQKIRQSFLIMMAKKGFLGAKYLLLSYFLINILDSLGFYYFYHQHFNVNQTSI